MSTKLRSYITRILKPLLLTVMGLILFLFGALVTVYSPWFQDAARLAVVKMMSSRPDTRLSLASFHLWFPMRLELGGFAIVQSGDTLVSADHLDARVSLLPLLSGEAVVNHLSLSNATYRMGNRDSATAIAIRAGQALLEPARVTLSPLHINAVKGDLSDVTVDLFINPNPPRAPKDTTAAPPPSTSP